jgi:hypothetical protein
VPVPVTATDGELNTNPAVSSSTIVKVTPVTVKPDPETDKTTVSSDSSTRSSTIVNVADPEIEPAAIVNTAGNV